MAGKTWQPSHGPPHTWVYWHYTQWLRVESKGGKGREKPFNAPHKMLLLPASLTNKLYNPKHEESDACTNTVQLETTWIFAVGLPQSKCRFNLQFDHSETSSSTTESRGFTGVNFHSFRLYRGCGFYPPRSFCSCSVVNTISKDAVLSCANAGSFEQHCITKTLTTIDCCPS